MRTRSDRLAANDQESQPVAQQDSRARHGTRYTSKRKNGRDEQMDQRGFGSYMDQEDENAPVKQYKAADQSLAANRPKRCRRDVTAVYGRDSTTKAQSAQVREQLQKREEVLEVKEQRAANISQGTCLQDPIMEACLASSAPGKSQDGVPQRPRSCSISGMHTGSAATRGGSKRQDEPNAEQMSADPDQTMSLCESGSGACLLQASRAFLTAPKAPCACPAGGLVQNPEKPPHARPLDPRSRSNSVMQARSASIRGCSKRRHNEPFANIAADQSLKIATEASMGQAPAPPFLVGPQAPSSSRVDSNMDDQLKQKQAKPLDPRSRSNSGMQTRSASNRVGSKRKHDQPATDVTTGPQQDTVLCRKRAAVVLAQVSAPSFLSGSPASSSRLVQYTIDRPRQAMPVDRRSRSNSVMQTRSASIRGGSKRRDTQRLAEKAADPLYDIGTEASFEQAAAPPNLVGPRVPSSSLVDSNMNDQLKRKQDKPLATHAPTHFMMQTRSASNRGDAKEQGEPLAAQRTADPDQGSSLQGMGTEACFGQTSEQPDPKVSSSCQAAALSNPRMRARSASNRGDSKRHGKQLGVFMKANAQDGSVHERKAEASLEHASEYPFLAGPHPTGSCPAEGTMDYVAKAQQVSFFRPGSLCASRMQKRSASMRGDSKKHNKQLASEINADAAQDVSPHERKTAACLEQASAPPFFIGLEACSSSPLDGVQEKPTPDKLENSLSCSHSMMHSSSTSMKGGSKGQQQQITVDIAANPAEGLPLHQMETEACPGQASVSPSMPASHSCAGGTILECSAPHKQNVCVTADSRSNSDWREPQIVPLYGDLQAQDEEPASETPADSARELSLHQMEPEACLVQASETPSMPGPTFSSSWPAESTSQTPEKQKRGEPAIEHSGSKAAKGDQQPAAVKVGPQTQAELQSETVTEDCSQGGPVHQPRIAACPRQGPPLPPLTVPATPESQFQQLLNHIPTHTAGNTEVKPVLKTFWKTHCHSNSASKANSLHDTATDACLTQGPGTPSTAVPGTPSSLPTEGVRTRRIQGSIVTRIHDEDELHKKALVEHEKQKRIANREKKMQKPEMKTKRTPKISQADPRNTTDPVVETTLRRSERAKARNAIQMPPPSGTETEIRRLYVDDQGHTNWYHQPYPVWSPPALDPVHRPMSPSMNVFATPSCASAAPELNTLPSLDSFMVPHSPTFVSHRPAWDSAHTLNPSLSDPLLAIALSVPSKLIPDLPCDNIEDLEPISIRTSLDNGKGLQFECKDPHVPEPLDTECFYMQFNEDHFEGMDWEYRLEEGVPVHETMPVSDDPSDFEFAFGNCDDSDEED